jgi:Flp pilus assembly protein TadD
MGDRIKPLLGMLEQGRDSALLRFSLGNEYAAAGELEHAASHLQRAVELDRGYSAAWKLLGKCLAGLGRSDEAMEAYSQGIEVAGEKGDRQAVKEMTVFLRRLREKRPAKQASQEGK